MSISGIGSGSSGSSGSVGLNQDETKSNGNRYGVLRNKENDQDEVIISYDATDDLSALRRLFRNEINKLTKMHDSETDSLLAKLDDVTEKFQTLSDESTGTIHGLERKVTSLSAKIGRMLTGLDRSGGGHMALRDLLRFRQVASLGAGAFDKLMATVGTNEHSSSNQRFTAKPNGVSGTNTISLLA